MNAVEREQLPRLLACRYRLVKRLGGGGMAAAYRAWDDGEGRLVAVKIPGPAAAGGGFLARFEQEVRTAQGLVHEHVVPVLDAGVAGKEPYLVMPFLAGGTLAQRQRDAAGSRQPLPAATLHAWLPAIAAALDHAHAEGVVHRDVKPANILFDAFGRAYLADFGIAKLLEDGDSPEHDAALTRANVAIGTEYYIAPERFARRAVLDGRCDQYSLAVCVWEILAGRRPFEGESGHIALEHCNAPLPPLPAGVGRQLPAGLWPALERALAKQRNQRFPSCTTFAQAVLAEIPELQPEAGSVTVVCPACDHYLKLPVAAAGRQGACRVCRTRLEIASDATAVWPVGEEAPPSLDPAPEPAGPPVADRRLRWGRPAAAAGVAGLLAVLVAVVSSWPRPQDQAESAASAVTEVSADQPAADAVPSAESDPPPTVAENPPVVGDAAPAVADLPPAVVDLPPAVVDTPPAVAAKPAVAEELPAHEQAAMTEPPPPVGPPAVELPPDDVPPQPVFVPPGGSGLIEEIHWVRVADPGNHADEATGLGAVADTFLIGRYELTNREYARFLNESAAGRLGLHGVAEGPLGVPAGGEPAAIRQLGEPGAFRYEVTPGMELMPVIGLRWCDAARLANWLHHGGLPDSDTEQGAYDLADCQPSEVSGVPKRPEARVWIPSRDEWYKAAYYKGAGTESGYWSFPTGSMSPPSDCEADEAGIGLPGNRLSANFSQRSRWPGGVRLAGGGCLTAVGSNGPEGPYGTFDMGGNAIELVTISEDLAAGSAMLGLCGGDAGSGVFGPLRAAKQKKIPESGRGGVRLARADDSSFTPLPPLQYERLKKLPKPTQARLEELRSVLDRIANVPLGQALPAFFQAELRRLNGIQDNGLAAPLRAARDTGKGIARKAEREATRFLEAFNELIELEKVGMNAAELLGGALKVGVAQDVRNLFQTRVNDYDAALQPIRDQARLLLDKLDQEIVPTLRK
jgi:formylglycine-generating enzyme required for sulfatase activity